MPVYKQIASRHSGSSLTVSLWRTYLIRLRINWNFPRESWKVLLKRSSEYVFQKQINHPVFLPRRRQERVYLGVAFSARDNNKRRVIKQTFKGFFLLAKMWFKRVCIFFHLITAFHIIDCKRRRRIRSCLLVASAMFCTSPQNRWQYSLVFLELYWEQLWNGQLSSTSESTGVLLITNAKNPYKSKKYVQIQKFGSWKVRRLNRALQLL